LGYAVLYRYYHYPQGARLRLSQILVLPPQQGRGAGTMLLQAATRLADEMGACDLAVGAGVSAQPACANLTCAERACIAAEASEVGRWPGESAAWAQRRL
jgi:GNAT superfamily N-acetyltransferase